MRAVANEFPQLNGVRALLAALCCAIGRRDEAEAHVAWLARDGFATVRRDLDWLACLTTLAPVCAALDDRVHAAGLYGVLAPYAGRHALSGAAISYRGAVDHHLGVLAAVLGQWRRAAAHFEAVLAQHRGVGARPWLARTQQACAEALLRGGATEDRRRALDLVRQARATAEELGMAPLAQAAALLGETAHDLPRAAAGPVRADAAGGLTARELEVLRLIAAGYTNNQIAAALVLSVRTVERHIETIYGKLGSHGKAARAVATAYALSRGLAAPSPHEGRPPPA